MKVVKTTTSKSETSATLDLFEGRDLSPKIQNRIREEVGTYIVEQSLAAVAESKSPVMGESIPALKKGPYREKKAQELGTTRADLQYSGEMLDELDFRPAPDGIKVGVFGERAPAADGHNNLSGKSSLPRRRFIPDEGQEYKSEIKKEVSRIVADVIAEETRFKKSDFAGVETKSELLKVLRSKFGAMSNSELTLTVYRNEDLLDLLISLKLNKLLG